MTTTADATAAPGTLRLRGVEYRLKPMTHADIGEFERWLQDEHIAITRRNLENEPPEMRGPLLKEAYARASRIHMNSFDGEAIQSTFEGGSRIFWLCLRQEHPNMTLDDAQRLLCDPETELADLEMVNEVMAAIERLNRPLDKEATPPAKKPKRRARKVERTARKINRKK